MTTEPTMPTAIFPTLEGKIVLITGACRGIGKAIAAEFAKQKSHLMLVDIVEGVEQTAAELASTYDTKVNFLLADVTDPARVKEVVDETVRPYDRHLDVLVNNAGITRDRLTKGMRDDDWNAVIATNLTGTHNFCKASVRYLRKAKGAVINLSSIVALVGNAGQSNYCAAKGGIISYTKALATEAPDVRFTVICPGFIETDMTAGLPQQIKDHYVNKTTLKRAGKPWEVAQAAVLRAVDYGNTYSSCSVVLVAGGMELGG
jgi:3-oxoacyl-[acyl-carrier protein] reductase